ncbi:hypothetical protein O181_126497 [Austropuccinia psidii MF-1]|uniref:Uncharacterized protein n=1 Tax=Austropuccinia psidii MF-1 TaxID=1389203 RepID=A0A9Q3KTH8_9BASI|nr:hypothetical protein [Austropuccinia psidii MF-1]
MSSQDVGFAANFFNAFRPFTTEELEDLVLGIPPTNRLRKSVWEWLTANGPYPTFPPSPPALGDLSSAPTGSSDHGEPHLFIPKVLQKGPTFFALVIL